MYFDRNKSTEAERYSLCARSTTYQHINITVSSTGFYFITEFLFLSSFLFFYTAEDTKSCLNNRVSFCTELLLHNLLCIVSKKKLRPRVLHVTDET